MQKLVITLALAPIALFLAASAPVHAQETFPSRPITLIVPFPPGGSTDVAGRIIADKMGAFLGQPVIVENVGGAGDRKSTRLNSSHVSLSRMPSSA